MTDTQQTILYSEVGLAPGTPYVKSQWRDIASHTDHEIRGFFGDYRFLSNFWPCVVFFEGNQYTEVENAYKAAKVIEPIDRAFMRL